MARSTKYIIWLLVVFIMLPLLMWAQQNCEPRRTHFIIDGVAINEDKICRLDVFSSDSARIAVSHLFPDILPAYITEITAWDSICDYNIVKVKTAPPRSFIIVVDGEPYKLPGMTFGIWLNEDERGNYLRNFLNNRGLRNNNIATTKYLIYADTHIGCNVPLPTIVITTKQYPHISKTDFKPFQFDNGDDYVRCERYRVVDKSGKIGYANPQGYIVIEPKYAFGFPFENGKAKVTDKGEMKEVENSNGEYHYWDSDDWYYIDQWGNRLSNK